jgi:hypothetical protein
MKQQTIITAILSGALLATGCAATSSSRAHSGYSDGSLVGAWRGKIQFKTGTFSTIKDLEFMYVFNAGGSVKEWLVQSTGRRRWLDCVTVPGMSRSGQLHQRRLIRDSELEPVRRLQAVWGSVCKMG